MWHYCRCKGSHSCRPHIGYSPLFSVIPYAFTIFLLTFVADMEKQPFVIRKYGRMELAQLYSPDIQPESAWVKLKQWIDFNPGLANRLRALGYDSHLRSFTPAQVRAIVEALGEP